MSENRKVGFDVTANNDTKQAFDEIKRDAADMAGKVEQAGKRAGDGIKGIGAGGDQAAQSLDKFTRSIIGSIQRATAATEAGGKSTAQYYEAIAKQRGISGDVLEPYIAQLRKAEAAHAAANATMGGLGNSAKQTTAAMRQLPMQLTDIVVSLQGGQSAMQVFMQQGGQLKDLFGGIGPAARAMGGYVAGLANPFTISAAAAGVLGVAYNQGAKEADAYRLALVSTGNATGATIGQMNAMAASIDGVVGTQGKAAETLALFASQAVAGAGSLEKYAQSAIAWERASGQAVGETAKQFASLKNEPLQGVLKLNEGINFLTDSVYQQIKSLEDQGKTTEAAKVAQDALANALDGRSAEMVKNLGTVERAWKGIKDVVSETWDAIKSIGRDVGPEGQLEAVNAQIAVLEGRLAKATQWEKAEISINLEKARAQQAELSHLAAVGAIEASIDADRATRIKARAEADKDALRYLSDKQKMQRQIAEETERIKRAYTGQTDADSQRAMASEIEKREQSIRDSYKKTAKTHADAGQSEVATIRAKVIEQERYLATLQAGGDVQKMGEGERLVIKLQEELKNSMTGAARANKEKALAAAEALAAADKQVAAELALVKSIDDTAAAYNKELAAAAQNTDSINDKAKALELGNATYGKGAIAIEQYNLQLEQERLRRLNTLGLQGGVTQELEREIAARERLVAAMQQAEYKAASKQAGEQQRAANDALNLTQEEFGLMTRSTDERKRIIAARQAENRLAEDLLKIEAMSVTGAQKEELRIAARATNRARQEADQNRVTLDEWARTVDQYDGIFRNGFADMLNNGKDGWKSFTRSLVTTFKTSVADQIYKMFAQKWVMNIVANIAGVMGGGAGGAAAQAASGGNGLMGMASNAHTAYQMYTGQGMWGSAAQTVGGWFGYGSAATGLGLTASAGAGTTLAATGAGLGMTGSAAGAGYGFTAAGTGYGITAGSAGAGTIGAGVGTSAAAGGTGAASTGLAAIPVWGWIAAAVVAVIGNLVSRKVEQRGAGLIGTLGEEDGIKDMALMRKGGSLFGGPKWWAEERGVSAMDDGLQTVFKQSRDNLMKMGDALGLATDGIKDFTTTLGTDELGDNKKRGLRLDGLSEQEAQAKIAQALATASNEMAQQLIGSFDADGAYVASEFARSGEQALDTLTRLATSITSVNQVFENLGYTLYEASLKGGDMASQLADLFGGEDKMGAATGSYMQDYYSEGERRAAMQRQLQKKFDEIKLEMPDIDSTNARAEYRKLVEAQDLTTESGRKTWAALIQLSPAFASVTEGAESAAASAESVAEKMKSAFGMTAESLSSLLKDAVTNAETADEARRNAAQAFEDQFYDGALTSLTDSLGSMLQSSIIGPMMESLVAGAATSSMTMAVGASSAAVAMATGGVAGATATATGGGMAASAMATGGDAAANAMAAGGSAAASAMAAGGQAAGARVDAFLEKARIHIGNYAQILADPEVQAGIKDIGKLIGDVAGLTFDAQQSWGVGGGGGFAGGGGGGGAAGEADKLSEALKRLGDTMAGEVKRLRGLMVDDSADSRAALMAQFVSGTAAARAGDIKAAEKLPEISKALEAATAASALNAVELARMRGWLAGSLEETAGKSGLKLPGFAVGTNYVPHDMAAMIHEGEAIVPKAFNPWAGGAAGGRQDNAELVSELRALRRQNAEQAADIARLNLRVARVLEGWEAGGMPAERNETWSPA